MMKLIYGLMILIAINANICKADTTNDLDSDISNLMKIVRNSTCLTEVESAILNGAEINQRDKNGMTALMYAASLNSNPEVIKVLLSYGANVKDTDTNGKNAIDHAQNSPAIYKSSIYWKMNDLLYN